MWPCEKTSDKHMKNKTQHTQPTDLISTGVEEVAQADYVAVVQLPHDLELTVLNKTQTKGTHYILVAHHIYDGESLETLKTQFGNVSL